MDIKTIVKVTSKAWSLDILALMHAGTMGRQSSLLSASSAGRTALNQSLNHLVDIGLIERNPGHGHPLRPEFLLTPQGVEIAIFADKIKKAVSNPNEQLLLRRTWSIPVLIVSQKPRYFTDIRNDLLTITDRALSQSLKQLEAKDWLLRKIDPASRPPRPLYQASNVGACISQAINL